MMVDHTELLLVGMSAKTYRVGNRVIKISHDLPNDPAVTQQYLESCQTEALVYQILGEHPRIAQCLSWHLSLGQIELKLYPNGTLKDYLERNHSSAIEADKIR